MKKQVAIFLGITAFAVNVYGQVSVINKNHVVVGTPAITHSGSVTPSLSQEKASSLNPTGLLSDTVKTDPNAALTILGKGPKNAGGYITFGGGDKYLGIGDLYRLESPYIGLLHLFAYNGLQFTANGSVVFAYNRTLSPIFKFSCPVSAQGVTLSSDMRLKADVHSLNDEYQKLTELNSISYRIKDMPFEMGNSSEVSVNHKIDEAEKITSRIQYGYVAQEVKEIFPDLVIEDENGYLSVDYFGFIPMLVDAYKSVKEELDYVKEQLSVQPKTKKGIKSSDIKEVDNENSLDLMQNRPNPFNNTTTIECFVPEDVTSAFIGIYDLQGKQVMRFDIKERGNTSVCIDGTNLSSGMYVYALVTDGEEVISKRMILTD